MGFLINITVTLSGTIQRHRFVAKVPVHWIKQLHGLLVCPDGVHDKCEQSESSEEEHKMRQSDMDAELSPMGEANPPHVVSEHHSTVECVDHHPLVSSPQKGVSPTSL